LKNQVTKTQNQQNRKLLVLCLVYGFLYCLAVLLAFLLFFGEQKIFLMGAVVGVLYFCSSLWLYNKVLAALTGGSRSKLFGLLALSFKLPILLAVLYLVVLFGLPFGLGFASGVLIHLLAFLHFAIHMRTKHK